MDKIRDLRHKGKYVIDDIYVDKYAKVCGIYATGIYNSLCRHANKAQTCFPSKRLIAKELKMSERKVYDGLKTLVYWNIIRIEDQGRKNNGLYNSKLYTLFDMSQWRNIPSASGAVGTEEHNPQAYGAEHAKQVVPNKETQEEGNTDKETQQVFSATGSFSLFWEQYPKKVRRKQAEEIWKKKGLGNFLPEVLVFIEKAKNTDKWKKGFIDTAPNFLNGELWHDDLSEYGSVKANTPSNLLVAPKNKYENYK